MAVSSFSAQSPTSHRRNYFARSKDVSSTRFALGTSKPFSGTTASALSVPQVRSVVETYVADQLGHHRMADPRVQQGLAPLQKCYPEMDLSFTSHGEYWSNVHVAIVNDDRWMEVRQAMLSALCDVVKRLSCRR